MPVLFTFRTFINNYSKTSALDGEALHLLEKLTFVSFTSAAVIRFQVTRSRRFRLNSEFSSYTSVCFQLFFSISFHCGINFV